MPPKNKKSPGQNVPRIAPCLTSSSPSIHEKVLEKLGIGTIKFLITNPYHSPAGLLTPGSSYLPAFPSLWTVAKSAFVTGYSGGTVPDLHRIPY